MTCRDNARRARPLAAIRSRQRSGSAILAFAATLLASGAVAQQTLVVPTQYPSVPAAVAAANTGDTILVRAGSYDDVGVINKGIAILCDPGVVFTRTFLGGSFVVDGIPAGETLVWRGGHVIKSIAHQWSPFEVRGCQGAVVVEGLGISGAQFGPLVLQCAQVHWHGCTLPMLEAIGSNVSASECSIWRCVLQNARVAIGRSTVRAPGAWMTGIQSTLSDLTIGSGTVVEGRGFLGAAIPAIDATGGTLRIDPGTVLISGTTPIAGTAQVTFVSVPTTSAAMVGQILVAEVLAAPGSTTATFVSASVPPLALPFGDLWVSPASLVLDVGVVPAIGVRRVTVVVPPLPRSVPLVLQPGSLLPTGSLVFGAPTGVVLD